MMHNSRTTRPQNVKLTGSYVTTNVFLRVQDLKALIMLTCRTYNVINPVCLLVCGRFERDTFDFSLLSLNYEVIRNHGLREVSEAEHDYTKCRVYHK